MLDGEQAAQNPLTQGADYPKITKAVQHWTAFWLTSLAKSVFLRLEVVLSPIENVHRI